MTGAQLLPDGTFRLANLAPGEYVLRAQRIGNPVDTAEVAMTTLTVAGVDITDVELVSAPLPTAVGRLIADSGTMQALSGARLSVFAQPMPPAMPMMGVQPAHVTTTFRSPSKQILAASPYS